MYPNIDDCFVTTIEKKYVKKNHLRWFELVQRKLLKERVRRVDYIVSKPGNRVVEQV